MVRSALSKVMWVGRATVFLVGLAVILALVLGGASMAFAANGQNFILGSLNNAATAMTKLTGNVAGKPALQIVNPNTAAGSQALQLLVAAGKPPLVVNPTAGKAINLNADKVDGQSFACPGGTLFHEGVCIDVARRAASATLINAERDCLDEGKRLPTVAELQTFRIRGGHDFTGLFYREWTSARDYFNETLGASVVHSDGEVGWYNTANPQNYRCVAFAS